MNTMVAPAAVYLRDGKTDARLACASATLAFEKSASFPFFCPPCPRAFCFAVFVFYRSSVVRIIHVVERWFLYAIIRYEQYDCSVPRRVDASAQADLPLVLRVPPSPYPRPSCGFTTLSQHTKLIICFHPALVGVRRHRVRRCPARAVMPWIAGTSAASGVDELLISLVAHFLAPSGFRRVLDSDR